MKKFVLIVFVVSFAGLFLTNCGDDECVVCPPEQGHVPDHHLLYAYTGDGYEKWVLTYSTKTGQVIDSTDYGLNIFSNMVFSHSGEYACYTSNYNLELGTSETWVTNWPEGDTVAYLPGIGALAAYVTSDDQYLLLTGGNVVAILTFPSLSIVHLDSVSSWAGALHPARRLAYVTIEPYWDSIFVIDYSDTDVKLTSHQLVDSQGQARVSLGPALCTGEYLIFVVPDRDKPGYLGIFDPLTLEVIRDRPLRSSQLNNGKLHPDGRRIFLLYNNGFELPFGGGIDVYDLETDILTPYIRMNEIDIGYGGFLPSNMEFTPDGKYAFIANGGIGLANGPILEIDIETKEVTRRWDHRSGISRLLRLNPKDWSQ